MSLFDQFDLMARGGSLALLALWCWLLLRDHPRILAARLAILMNIAIACYLVVTVDGMRMQNSPFGLLLALGAGATPGLFWMFAKAWFNDESRVGWQGISWVLLSVVNLLILQLTSPGSGMLHLVSGVMFRFGMLAFAGAGLWEAWAGRTGDLVEGRRRLRPRIVAVVGAYVILIAFAEIAVFNAAFPRWIMQMVASSIALITFLFCAAMFGMRQSDLFGAVVDPARTPQARSFVDDKLAHKLSVHMNAMMAWRDESLTIAGLAGQLDEQEYRLRRVINGQLGHRNFAAFLNAYRLAEVKAALLDPAQREVPIITIALDAGFGSLGPFNRAFRESESMTPTEFRIRRNG
ncbi:MAG: helix-turn-helix domain-containing protein [Sphingorhabdus sp.]